MISGLLNINKPQGITSHDVVARVRKLAEQRKVGHAGTLDPMATGVLLVFLGQGTRVIEYVVGSHKQYRATICFGTSTDTLDAEGKVTATTDASHLTETQLRDLLPEFLGDIEQVPPLYSAIKRNGQPLYKLARAGQIIDVPPRQITIDSLTWVSWEPPHLTVDVVCSAGTYIRSLARDLGDAAGTGAHLTRLTRTASGTWTLDDAVTLEQLENDTQWGKYLHPLDQAITHLPRVDLTKAETTEIGFGRRIEVDSLDKTPARAYTPDGEFLAILTRVDSDDKLWKPKKVFLSDPAS